jgi:hypothetical protein
MNRTLASPYMVTDAISSPVLVVLDLHCTSTEAIIVASLAQVNFFG